MSTALFQKATKRQLKLRMAITGPSGSGKTFTALIAAKALAGGGKIAVIDTEHGGASKYADQFNFDVVELTDFNPQRYIEAIEAAEETGYTVVVIDSLSHAWNGKGGILQIHDDVVAREKGGNSFAAWRDPKKLQGIFKERILSTHAHVIATMRSKMDYSQDVDDSGRKTIKRVGLAPVQEDGMEYEFDIVGDMNQNHTLMITKTRCSVVDGKNWERPTVADFAPIVAWLNSGDAPLPRAETTTTKVPTTGTGKLTRPYPPDVLKKGLIMKAAAISNNGPLTPAQRTGIVTGMNAMFVNDQAEAKDIKRHGLLTWVFGKGSTNDLTFAEASALMDWLKSAEATQEAALVIKSLDLGIGQTEMPLEPEPQTEEVAL